MTTRRIGLTHLMALIVVLAAGLGAMRAASETLARVAIFGSLAALLLATVGAIVRPRGRGAWVGFAVFGWGYALVAIGEPLINGQVLSRYFQVDDLAFEVVDRLHPYSPVMANPFPSEMLDHRERDGSFYRLIDGQHVPFDAADQKLYADFADQVSAQDNLVEARKHATQIGLAFQGIVFALTGGFAGGLLARPMKARDQDAQVGGES